MFVCETFGDLGSSFSVTGQVTQCKQCMLVKSFSFKMLSAYTALRVLNSCGTFARCAVRQPICSPQRNLSGIVMVYLQCFCQEIARYKPITTFIPGLNSNMHRIYGASCNGADMTQEYTDYLCKIKIYY